MIRTFRVVLNGKQFKAEIEETTQTPAALASASMPAPKYGFAPVSSERASTPAPSSAPLPVSSSEGAKISIPLPSIVLKICVKEGQNVKKGQLVAVLEAMKMENEVFTQFDGIVKSIEVKEGDSVNTGETLMTIG